MLESLGCSEERPRSGLMSQLGQGGGREVQGDGCRHPKDLPSFKVYGLGQGSGV